MSDDLFRRRTDGVDGLYALLNERAHKAVVGVLVLATQDQVNARREGRNGLHGGIDIGGFGVVVVVDAVDSGDKFKAVLYGVEGFDRAADGFGCNLGKTGG